MAEEHQRSCQQAATLCASEIRRGVPDTSVLFFVVSQGYAWDGKMQDSTAGKERAEEFYGKDLELIVQLFDDYRFPSSHEAVVGACSLDAMMYDYAAGLHLLFMGDLPTAVRLHAQQCGLIKEFLAQDEPNQFTAMFPCSPAGVVSSYADVRLEIDDCRRMTKFIMDAYSERWLSEGEPLTFATCASAMRTIYGF